ncbi:MAG: division/cell wall cluster transcriptional repressor MraZ [Bacilli bacterium]
MGESGIMFFGRFDRSLDNKGRLSVPAKFKSSLTSVCYIMKGFDGALAIYNEDEFLKLWEEVKNLPFNKTNNRKYIRSQLATVCELEIDGSNRIQIPQELLTRYSIGKDVSVIGVGNHLELWDKAKYEQYELESEQEFDDIAENIEKE